MVRRVDAIFSQGAFRLLGPLVLPEGTRVHLSVEEKIDPNPMQRVGKIYTPKLAHLEDAADFVMEIREMDDAGV